MTDLTSLSTTQLIGKLRTKELSSVELLDHFIERYETINSKINAVVATNFEQAREQAHAIDERKANGQPVGALYGLPMTVKDSFEVMGMPTTSGSPDLKNHYATENAVAVQRLIDEGAIVYGKTNLPLFAGEWQSFNELYGTTNNPWDLARSPGGSSGGAAAALAGGMTTLEVGSDIGGSIRIPAHCCGVYGHKPTYGIVPQRGHIPGPPGTRGEPDLAVTGPMGLSAEDLTLALNIMAGPDAHHINGWRLKLPRPRKKRLQNYRIAYFFDDSDATLEPEVRTVLNSMVDALRREGATLVDVLPADLSVKDVHEPYMQLLGSIIGSGIPDSLRKRLPLLRLGLKVQEKLGRVSAEIVSYLQAFTLPHYRWMQLNEKRVQMQHRISQFFNDYDVLLMPISPMTAIPHTQEGEVVLRQIPAFHGSRPYTDHSLWISLATLLGLPATSAPIGTTDDGLPVNIQIVGAAYNDFTTIEFARTLAQVIGGFTSPPTL